MTPTFQSGTVAYSIDSTTNERVTITAVPNSDSAKVSGTGEKTLKYGKNSFNIVVTSESGAINTCYLVLEDSEVTPAKNCSGARTYTVQKGDSLWAISQKFYGTGIRYYDIKKENNLTNDRIFVGQVLRIP